MAADCKANNTEINICKKILYEEYDVDTETLFFNMLNNFDFNNIDFETWTWILSTLNFLATTNMQDRTKFIMIEKFKLDFLAILMNTCNYVIIHATKTKEIYFENDIATIFAQYIPKGNDFILPNENELGHLIISGPAKDGSHNNFIATVEIDSQGYVTSILKEPELQIVSDTPQDFNDIYTDLLSDILQYEDED